MNIDQAASAIGARVAYLGDKFILIGAISEVDEYVAFVNFETVVRAGLEFQFPQRFPVNPSLLVFYYGPLIKQIKAIANDAILHSTV